MKTATSAPEKVGHIVRAWRSFRAPETPRWKKGMLVAALVYVVVPTDLVPDVAPILGWIDDAAVLSLAIAQLLKVKQEDTTNDAMRRT